MITYQRTSWYGIGYLFQLKGSVFPRCFPACVFAGTFNGLVAGGYIDMTGGGGDGDASGWLSHPYTFQLVGIVFGYLMVTRINMSYARYWEGVTMVKNMHSKWADACGQIIAFDRSLSTETNLTSDPFCCHIVRLFSQMSAMATMRLHIVEPGESILFEEMKGKHPSRIHLPNLTKKGAKSASKSSVRVAPEASGTPLDRDKTEKQLELDLAVQSNAELGSVAHAAANYQSHGGDAKKEKNRAEKVSELAEGITAPERDLLLAAPCPVFATAQRIQRAIVTRLHAGGMRAPPPIISRIFQEVSNGCVLLVTLLALSLRKALDRSLKGVPSPPTFASHQVAFL